MAPNPLPLQVPAAAAPTLFRCSARSEPCPSPSNAKFPLQWQSSSQWGAIPKLEGMGRCKITGQSLGQSQTASSTLFLGVSQHMHVLNEQRLGFLLVPLTFIPGKEVLLSGVGYQGWGSQHVLQATLSQGGSLNPQNSSSLLSSPRGTGPELIACLHILLDSM